MKDSQPSTWVSFFFFRGLREEEIAKEGQEKKGLDQNLGGVAVTKETEKSRDIRDTLKLALWTTVDGHLNTYDLIPSSCMPELPHRNFFSLFLPSLLYVSLLSICAHVHKCKCLCVEVRGQHQGSSLFSILFLRQSLLNLELTHGARP